MRNVVLSYIIQVLQDVLQIFHKQYSLDYILSNLESSSIWVGNALTAHFCEKYDNYCLGLETSATKVSFCDLLDNMVRE